MDDLQLIEIIDLLLRVPPQERERVLDLIRSVCPTPAYVQEREDCLRRMGIVPPYKKTAAI